MILVEFEQSTIDLDDFSNNKKDAPEGARWYTANQKALLFTGVSRYPDKFDLNLSFSASPSEQRSAVAFPTGRYFLRPSAFSLDMTNRGRPACDFSQLELVTVDGIDLEINKLKALRVEISGDSKPLNMSQKKAA